MEGLTTSVTMSAHDQLQLDKMNTDCACGLKAIFYCVKDCMRLQSIQKIYCRDCKKYHEHAPEFISDTINVFGKSWSPTFEKGQELQQIIDIITNDNTLTEFTKFCEKGNEFLSPDRKYKGEQKITHDLQVARRLLSELMNTHKEKIEEHIINFEINQLISMEEQRERYDRELQKFEYLKEVTPEFLFNRYLNVFISLNQQETGKYSKDTLKIVCCFYKRGFYYICSSELNMDPQQDQRIINQLFMQMIQMTFETMDINDQSNQKQISDIRNTVDKSDQKILKDKLLQQEERIQQLNDRLEDYVNSSQNQIQLLKQQNKYISRFAKSHAVIKTKTLPWINEPIRAIYQLQNGCLITGNSGDKSLIDVFDKKIREIVVRIECGGCGPNLLQVIEHQGLIFILTDKHPNDRVSRIFVVRSSDYQLIHTHEDSTSGRYKYSMTIVDNNTLLCGLQNGYLQLFDIQNNTLEMKFSEQVLTNNTVEQLIRIGDTNQFLARVVKGGISVIEVSNDSCTHVYTFNRMGYFSYFNSMVLLTNNLVLANESTTYYLLLLDIAAQQKITVLKKLNGESICYAMCLVPGFDYKQYPFVVAREAECIQLINVQKEKLHKICDHKGEFDGSKTEIQFLEDQDLRFVTCGLKGEVLMLELNKQYLSSML